MSHRSRCTETIRVPNDSSSLGVSKHRAGGEEGSSNKCEFAEDDRRAFITEQLCL
jgi:hypothetical protein